MEWPSWLVYRFFYLFFPSPHPRRPVMDFYPQAAMHNKYDWLFIHSLED